MLIDTKDMASPFTLEVRLSYRAILELACKDLAGYRDIETYINDAVSDQTLTFEILRYARWIGEANRICL